MKTLILFVYLITIPQSGTVQNTQEFTDLKGDYLGQTPPGDTPVHYRYIRQFAPPPSVRIRRFGADFFGGEEGIGGSESRYVLEFVAKADAEEMNLAIGWLDKAIRTLNMPMLTEIASYCCIRAQAPIV